MVEHLILRQDGELGIGATEVRKIMVFGDQIVHRNFLSQFLLRAAVGNYLDIDPHMYIMREQFSRIPFSRI